MIPYPPIAPLTVGPRKGWRPVLAAVVLAALLGTTATSAVAAEPEYARVRGRSFVPLLKQLRSPPW
jgi:hypothetical protein